MNETLTFNQTQTVKSRKAIEIYVYTSRKKDLHENVTQRSQQIWLGCMNAGLFLCLPWNLYLTNDGIKKKLEVPLMTTTLKKHLDQKSRKIVYTTHLPRFDLTLSCELDQFENIPDFNSDSNNDETKNCRNAKFIVVPT